MKASIEITDLEMIRGDVRLLRSATDAFWALVQGGGTAESMRYESQSLELYEFDGPDELVREVVTTLMTFKLAAAVEVARPIITAGIADDLFRPDPLMRLIDE